MSLNSAANDPGKPCEFQDNLNILRQISVFSPLPIESLKVFAYLCNRETFKEGEYLFRQDEDDGHAYYIISGSAMQIHKGDTEDVAIHAHGPASFIGGLTLIGKTPRLFSLRAAEDTMCLVMSRERFAKAIEQFPELMPKILQALVGRIYRWEKKFLKENAEAECDCLKRTGVSLI